MAVLSQVHSSAAPVAEDLPFKEGKISTRAAAAAAQVVQAQWGLLLMAELAELTSAGLSVVQAARQVLLLLQVMGKMALLVELEVGVVVI